MLILPGLRYDISDSDAENVLRVLMKLAPSTEEVLTITTRDRAVMIRTRDIVGLDGPREAMQGLRSRLGR